MSEEAPPAHLEASLWRTLALLAGALGFVALCVALLVIRPRGLGSGSLEEAAVWFGIPFFGLCAAVIARSLFRTGPVISVGPAGVFDRRISTDWLPWAAIDAISSTEMYRQHFLVLHLDPVAEAVLPIRARARRTATLNEGFGPRGYWISANALRGGFGALQAAIDRFAPRPADAAGAAP